MQIVLNPELRTTGGEVVDVFQNEKYLGTMTLVYREKDRLFGTVHLEDEKVSDRLKEQVFHQIQTYIQSMVQALDLHQCEVLIFYRGSQYVIDLDSFSESTPISRKSIHLVDTDDQAYGVRLIRDDIDALTYEVYDEDDEDTAIAIATIDIGKDQLSGTIDFHEPHAAEERELIATLILEELDKEKEYDKINLTMYVQNEYADEILFENEEVNL